MSGKLKVAKGEFIRLESSFRHWAKKMAARDPVEKTALPLRAGYSVSSRIYK